MSDTTKELWTVESGCYSDHRVLAVFEDEDTAKAWCEALKIDEDGWNRDAYVGTLPMVLGKTQPFKWTTWQYSVDLWDNGRTETKGPHARTEYAISSYNGKPPHRPSVRYVRAPCHDNKGGRIDVVGSSEKSVLKAANDRIAMWKAGAWGGPKHEEINETA